MGNSGSSSCRSVDLNEKTGKNIVIKKIVNKLEYDFAISNRVDSQFVNK
ncbi:hypothetical protein AsAng_0032220 [Aureispira anguillae]|uniref:Uncharacterized protein n=1 Tax=Aureispira anguillae TaxID=2864201 RepID=A0A915YGB8_9BACT|nr:hypothetical protein AsAng_0032220 [Aureispira anguillae]